MKILFVSMHSLHSKRWINNLKDSAHELYWFDVLDRGRFDLPEEIQQFTGWKKRKRSSLKGEYFLYKKIPRLYEKIQTFVETTAAEELERIILKINPDIIHSFEMQSCSYPILKTMQKHSEVKLIYSCWGNDLFFYKNQRRHRSQIKNVLGRVDVLHTDCSRDHNLALGLGFTGEFSGVIPGGGGYEISKTQEFFQPVEARKIILVKGYQHNFGRAIKVLQAVQAIQDQLEPFKIVVFAAHPVVVDYIRSKNLPYKYFKRGELSQEEVLELMGKSLIYIGNSISDGIPNTLIEAFIMGAFPIQSNPGGVSEELIENGSNGLLIFEPEDVEHLKSLILKAIEGEIDFYKSALRNQKISLERFDYNINKRKINELYIPRSVQKGL
ncbi:glycosyltransferase [Salinimicrobium sp. CDJ15-81-2]|nr:glycosyltransferase [Salinimicrobium nanhaiense]